MVNNIVNIALENLANLWEYDIWQFNTRLVQNLEYINVFLELWFKENLDTHRLVIKLEGTQFLSVLKLVEKTIFFVLKF